MAVEMRLDRVEQVGAMLLLVIIILVVLYKLAVGSGQ